MTGHWTDTTLGAICDAGDGEVKTGPFGSQLHKSDYIDDGVPVVMPTNLDEGRVSVSGIARISNENVTRLSKHKLIPGDIVYGRRGDIGRQALITSREEGWLCGTGCLRITLGQGPVDSTFLHYYLRNEEVIGYISNQAVGATMPNLNTKILRSIPVRHPDLSAQKKIAGILTAYDDLIENNRRRIKILEEMAQSLYREWFVYFRFPGYEKVKFVDSPLGKIPEGWAVKKLGDVAEDVRRGIPKGALDEETPYVGLEHIPRKSLALDDWEMVTELGSNKLLFQPGEILFGKIRPYFHKVSVAPFKGICSADTIVIRGKEAELHPLVTAIVSSEAFVAHASATANGAKMPRANWKVLVDYSVVQPPATLLEQFSSFFENVIQQQQALIRKNQNLRQTRNLLLPKLLSVN